MSPISVDGLFLLGAPAIVSYERRGPGTSPPVTSVDPVEPGLAPARSERAAAWVERNRFLVVVALLASFMGVSVGMLSPIVLARYGGRPAAPRALGWQALAAQLALLVRDREVRRITLLESLTQATGSFFTFFVVVVALGRAGLGASEASSLISAKGVTYIAALFLLGGSVQRLGPERAKFVSFAAISVGMSAVAVYHSRQRGGLV